MRHDKTVEDDEEQLSEIAEQLAQSRGICTTQLLNNGFSRRQGV